MPKRLHQLALMVMLCMATSVPALTPDQARAIAVGEGDARIEALRAAVAGADEKTVRFIQALSDDAVKVVAGQPVIVKDGRAIDPVSGTDEQQPHAR
jgi:urea transport system permease protein